MTRKDAIIKTALISRILVFALQYISNQAIPDHDANVFIAPTSTENVSFFDKIIFHLFGGFLRWDAQYFVHLSKHGYTYENSLAFFPLYPISVRISTYVFGAFVPLNLDSLTLIASLGINLLFFVLSALCLYELSIHIMKEEIAYKSAVLFCFNPASIFFSAPYTECLFSYLTFKSILNCILLYKKYCDIHTHLQVKDFVYIIPVNLSTITRSNGILNLGFLLYFIACFYLRNIKNSNQKIVSTLKYLFLTSILIVITLMPFILFQIFCYTQFCRDIKIEFPQEIVNFAKLNSFILPGTFSQHNQSWCFKKVPLAYSYVQDHYWNVGFLRYYEFKQIPNFLLGFPIIYLILKNSINFLSRFQIKQIFNFINTKSCIKNSDINPALTVFVIHATALTVFCVLNVHIQVTTRMLCSASPIVYWFAAKYIKNKLDFSTIKNINYKTSTRQECCILLYFISYFVVGTVIFCNFLPWT